MSFYVYYGKLKDELLVAVLPNGTVEHNDPIFLYTKKLGLTSHKATDVKVTADSEDLVNFKDNQSTYQLVTKKAYKELTLTIKAKTGNTSTVALTRHYNQPFTAIPASDPPRIWTGTIDFQSWAESEALFVIVPKGLGNGKPVVSIWQWTKDADKGERSLTYSTGTQQSQTGSPNTFSFKQNGYYTLDCRVNTKTQGLAVTVKNKESTQTAEQKELILAEKITVGAEHRFSPPRPELEHITMECHYPQATQSLKRYTGQLPFPADLVETLRYSAAYVDQAGYLAKHAVNQYNQLDKSYFMLEKKAEARAEKIFKLEADVARYIEENGVLVARNKELLKQIADNRAAAEAREAKLKTDLQKIKVDLDASEDKRAKAEAGRDAAEAEVKRQKDIIGELEVEIERLKKLAEENNKHDKKDHEIINDLEKKLAAAREAEAAALQKIRERDATIRERDASIKELQATIARRETTIKELNAKIGQRDATIAGLESDLAERNHRIVELTATLASTQKRLAEESKKVQKLEIELKTVTEERKKLTIALADETYKLGKAKADLLILQKDLDNKEKELSQKKTEVKNAQQKSDRNELALKTERANLAAAQEALRTEQNNAAAAESAHQKEQEEKDSVITDKDAKIKELQGLLDKADKEHEKHHDGKDGLVVHNVKTSSTTAKVGITEINAA